MSLELSNPNVNIGTVQAKTSKTFSVQLINNTNEPIQIIRVSVSCGSCTQANTSSSNVPAKGNIPMSVVFTPTSTAFSTTKQVTVFYRENNLEKSVILSFTAKVI